MKRCSRCLEVKPLSEFGIRNRLVKGERVKQYLSYCKKCNSEYSSKRYREMKSNNLKCIYRFLDIDNNVIYIGKTERLRYRMNQHLSNIGHLPKECYEMTKKIQFMSMKSTVLMDMREMYYINLYKPKFNSNHLYPNEPNFIISDFVNDKWIDYNSTMISRIDLGIASIREIEKHSSNDIKRVASIFKRKRNENYLVYIEYINNENKKVQKRKGTFKIEEEANELVETLKDIYFK